MSLLFFLGPFLLLAILSAIKVLLSGKTQLRLPPSPPGLLLLGNLHQLSSLPHRSLLDLSRKYGPVMLIRMGQVPALIVSSADAAQELFKTHDLAISTRPASKAAMKITFGARNISFAPYGERWRHAKKLAVVHLLSLKRVLSLQALRQEEVRRMMERVAAACAGGGRPRGEVELSEVLYEYANATVYHAAAGKETKEGRTAARFRAMIDDGSVLLGGFQVDDAFPALGWLSAITGTDAKLDRIGRRIDEFLSGILQEHIERAEQGFNRNEDFVDVLLSLQRDGAGDLGLAEIDIKAITLVSCELWHPSLWFIPIHLLPKPQIHPTGLDRCWDRHILRITGMGHGRARAEPESDEEAARRSTAGRRRQADGGRRGRGPNDLSESSDQGGPAIAHSGPDPGSTRDHEQLLVAGLPCPGQNKGYRQRLGHSERSQVLGSTRGVPTREVHGQRRGLQRQ